MVSATSPQLFVKNPQYVVESTEGTTPTSSPSFTTCGSVTSLELRKNDALIDIPQVGTEDVLDEAQGVYTYNLSMKMQFISSAFAKRFINAANYGTPTGTISESMTIAYSQYVNGTTEKFVLVKGCRPKRITFDANIGRPLEATVELEAMSAIEPTASGSLGLTTPSWASNPTGPVWTWLDGGSAPLSWNSISLNGKSLSVTVERNTTPEHLLGTANPFGTMPHARRITGSFTNLFTASEATTLENDWNTATARTLAYVLKSSTSTLTISSAKIESYTRAHSADDANATVEVCGFRAVSVSIT